MVPRGEWPGVWEHLSVVDKLPLPPLYDPKLDSRAERERTFEQFICALRSQRVEGKAVMIDLRPLIHAYFDIEKKLDPTYPLQYGSIFPW